MGHKQELSAGEERHLAAIRAMSPAARFGLAIELSETLADLNRAKIDGTKKIHKGPCRKAPGRRH